MRLRLLRLAVSIGLVALVVFAAGCTDGEETPSPSETPVVDPTATATPEGSTPTPAPDIRDEDLTQQAELRDFLASSGGEVNPEKIEYGDLTGDGVDDAVVPVASGGEGGDIAVFVLGYQPDGLKVLLRLETGRLKAKIEDGGLETLGPSYIEGDPICCPSQFLRTFYVWDGSSLVFESEEVLPGIPE